MEKVSADARVIPPTDAEEGSTVYTSRSFVNPAFEPRTAAVTIPALSRMNVLRLPDSLTGIEAEAFQNLVCGAILIPDGCTFIGSRAFADCPRLVYVRVPASIIFIAEDSFTGCDQAIIDCTEE